MYKNIMETQNKVSNLVLSGRLLIHGGRNNGKKTKLGFKPCFIWSAPYTLWYKLPIFFQLQISFKPCFIWLAPYT